MELIGRMPPKGRQLYNMFCGRDAKKMLDDALATGDVNKLARVSRRYFHTEAGYEATFLLGLNYLDHAAPSAAALTLRRLSKVPEAADHFEPALTLALASAWLQVGDCDKARDALLACKEQRPTLGMNVGGRAIAWFEKDSQAVDWLRRVIEPSQSLAPAQTELWPMYRGDPGGMPRHRPAHQPSASAGEFHSWKAWTTGRSSTSRMASARCNKPRRPCCPACIRWPSATVC